MTLITTILLTTAILLSLSLSVDLYKWCKWCSKLRGAKKVEEQV